MAKPKIGSFEISFPDKASFLIHNVYPYVSRGGAVVFYDTDDNQIYGVSLVTGVSWKRIDEE